jgi:hypothetical protein
MDINTGSQQNVSLGKMNPELTQSLAQAISPYVDDMAGRNLDGTLGWAPKDNSADLSYPHAVQVMGVLGTDDTAAKILDAQSASVQSAYINEYANSVINSGGQFADSHAMEAAGRLKGISDEGAFMAASDTESDATKARQAAWDRMARNYDAAKDLVGAVPYVNTALSVEATLMKDAILGPRPDSAVPGHTPIESSLGMRSALASAFIANNIGSQVDIERLSGFDINHDGQIDIPPESLTDRNRVDYVNALNNYFSHVDRAISDPFADYDKAYRDVLH